MFRRTTAPRAVRSLLLSACLLLACSAVARAETTVHFTVESVQAYEQQLSAGQIKAATFNKRLRSMHLTLADGRHVKVIYPKHDSAKLIAALSAKHIPVTVLKPAEAIKEKKAVPVHHKLRYIVGGIVLAIIVVVAIVLVIHRRRREE